MIDFVSVVEQESAKLTLLLNLIEPRCGGVILTGERGVGKSALLRTLKDLAKSYNFVYLPLNVTEETLLGGIDLEETLRSGKRVFQRGLLSKANQGFLVIENIDLFPPEILSVIFEVQSRGEVIVEREGFKIREPAKFQILATLNLEESDLSMHFLDRFGMCVYMETLREESKRREVIKANLFESFAPEGVKALAESVKFARELIKEVQVSEEILEFISELVIQEGIFSHRAEIYLYYASKAYTALLGERKVSEEAVRRVAPLVFIHRKRYFNVSRDEEVQPSESEDKKRSEARATNPNQEGGGDKREREGGKEEQAQSEYSSGEARAENVTSQAIPSSGKERILPIGESFSVRPILFRRDRKVRKITGKRTKTKVKGRGGRFIRSTLRKTPDIAISATLRAAAPFQKVRGKKDKLIISEEDLRFKEKERKMRHIVIFVVDGSGSMGVKERMSITKGAILSLLKDCYQKRDKVALIVFRKDRAETILPITSSVELALKKLKDIPTGGKTPLSAGLMEAYKLIQKAMLKEPEARFVVFLLTDGMANHTITNRPVMEEVELICKFLRDLPSTDFVVVDTENKQSYIKFNLALNLAQALGARYILMEDLKRETLHNLVNRSKLGR